MDRSSTRYLEHLTTLGKVATARSARVHLGHFSGWLASRQRTPLTATVDDLRDYQRLLASGKGGSAGGPLARSTQATRLATIKSLFAWLHRRGDLVADTAAALVLPRISAGPVRKDHLTLQEATALLQTKAAAAERYPDGCARWAEEIRELALLALALASGRRRAGLRDLDVEHIDLIRHEVRIEREKGSTGRVVPLAGWAATVLRTYIERARPILNWRRGNRALFVGDREPRLGANTIAAIVERAHNAAVDANPDLDELAAKRLTPHSLRVSFASLLFEGGANIRTINELMLHRQFGTTARYVPVGIEDLRRVCALAHPRP